MKDLNIYLKPEDKDYENILIKDATAENENKYVRIIGTLKVVEKKTKNSPAPYYMFIFSDASGSISSAIWSSSPLYMIADETMSGKLVEVCGIVKKNGEYINIDIEGLKEVELEEGDELLEKDLETPKIEDLKTELNKRVSKIMDSYLKKIVVLAIKENEKEITISPFSEKTAYAYRGGLLHQIVDMCDMVSATCEAINCGFWGGSTVLNEDLLLAGAILSNLGKCKTLKINAIGEIEKTKIGIMEEDSVLSRDIAVSAVKTAMYIYEDEANKSKKTFDRDYYETINMELLHMVSSVKTNTSWGALSTPRSKNAMMLSNINNMIYTKGLFESIEKNYAPNQFTKAYENGKQYYVGDNIE